MVIDPDEIKARSYAEIGHLIERDSEQLVDRWYRRALIEQPTAETAHRDEMHDHLPEFLRALGRELASTDPNQPRAKMRAVQHGEQRWRDGWRLAELVRDYQILRLVLFEWLDEQLDRPVTIAETFAIGLALDEAIGAAVVMYVAHQDEAQKRHEDSLRVAKDKAEAADRARTGFLANISHELRTPLNSILGLVQLSLEEQLSTTLRDYLSTVKDSADMMLALLNEVLDYSRIESGRLELDPHPFGLRQLLDDTLRILSTSADDRGLELACDLDAGVPDWLQGDPLRLRQILTNLVSNAIKFTNRGEVVVRVEAEAETDDALTLRFSVIDTGIGIALEAQSRIFEPFRQADRSTARHYGGTGLGLAISKELTQHMGGRIWVESELGQGSKFHFTARLDRVPAPPEPIRQTTAQSRLRSMSVLVVDDNPTVRRIIERALGSVVARVRGAENVAAARSALATALEQGQPFDLALIDAVLGRESGFEVAADDAAGAPTEVVMMFSNRNRSALAARCHAAGIHAYLIKPFSLVELLETVADDFGLAPADETTDQAKAASSGRRLRVLVAEDAPANQKLLRMILSRHGHEVVVVDNGREAVDKLESEPFDIVLMDLQMPVMDGIKATTLIRASMRPTVARVPIIALTAHAMPRDERRCLDAGMDGYLSKPIDAKRLDELLSSLCETAARPTTEPATVGKPALSPARVMNRSRALERLGGIESLFTDLVGFFYEDSPLLLNRLRESLASGDAESAHRAAHTLKSLAANFEGLRVIQVAQRIEGLTQDGALAEAAQFIDALETEVAELSRAIEPYRRT
jgi:signal transduction histidine kinase/DNA-binding response OmpR family regulator